MVEIISIESPPDCTTEAQKLSRLWAAMHLLFLAHVSGRMGWIDYYRKHCRCMNEMEFYMKMAQKGIRLDGAPAWKLGKLGEHWNGQAFTPPMVNGKLDWMENEGSVLVCKYELFSQSVPSSGDERQLIDEQINNALAACKVSSYWTTGERTIDINGI